MRRTFCFWIVSLAIGLLAVMPTSVRASEWDQLVYFTFNAPVEVPGVALPAGTYMFKLADADGNRNVIRVLSKDGLTVYATFFAIPDERMTAPDDPVVTFEETPAGAPEAIKAWFYPGDRVGHEFVYPKDQAQRIAAATRQPVLTSASIQSNQRPTTSSGSVTPVEQMKNASVSRVNERGETQPMHSETSAHAAPMKSLQPTTASATAASGRAVATSGKSNQTNPSSKQLPRTASALPLIGLCGLTSLALGLAARALRRG